MKKIVMVILVVVLVALGLANIKAHGEVLVPDGFEELAKTKVFVTEGQINGTWTIGFQRDENNMYPCAFDMGDGRIIMVPLTDDEVNALMYKAIDEAHQTAMEEQKKSDNRTFIAKAVDWIIFWN